MHGVPPLSWADDLAKDAQAWAEKLANARTLQHASKSERNDAGENIAMFTGSFDTAGEKATDMWYVTRRLLHWELGQETITKNNSRISLL